jgi:hypothetical protein
MTLALVCAGPGCGPRGPQRFDVSGRVTCGGAPVPAGTIIFEPDLSKGNDGPQGFAPIAGGSFDTARGGRGTVGGPHRVTILGCDGVPVSETSPQGKPLFDPFVTGADLPRHGTRLDFDVPDNRAGKTAR